MPKELSPLFRMNLSISDANEEAPLPQQSVYPSIQEVEAIATPKCSDIFKAIDQKEEDLARESTRCADESNRRNSFNQSSVPYRYAPRQAPSDRCRRSSSPQVIRKELRSSSTRGPSPGSIPIGTPAHIPRDRKMGPARTTSRVEIEVSPGIFMPLHGSEETVQALENGRLVPCYCCICNISLYCVQNADYVLCPQCRVVSPLDGYRENASGVGLGLTAHEYENYQRELSARHEGHQTIFIRGSLP